MKIKYLKIFIIFFVAIAFIILAAAVFWTKKERTCTNNCNIMLISVDSLRADHLGIYGYGRRTSPNLDSIAKKGYVFNNYYSATFLTPTAEAAVHTGLYPDASGMINFSSKLSASTMTLAEYMKRIGFNNYALVTSPEFVGNPGIEKTFSRGFNKYITPNKTLKDPSYSQREYPSDKYLSTFVKPDAENDRNFYWLAVGGVHWPFGYKVPNIFATTNYHGAFENKKLDLSLFYNVYDGYYYPGGNQQKIKLTNNDNNYVIDNYDNGVYAFDNFLGRIQKRLKETKLDKKTIIIIQSEHGEELGEHGYFAHYDILNSQVHTPLIIYDPRRPGNLHINSNVGSVDVLPTILDLVNTKTVNKLNGQSLVGIMDKKQSDNKQDVLTMRRPLWEEVLPINMSDQVIAGINEKHDVAIIHKNWKLIVRNSKDRINKISQWNRFTKSPIVSEKYELYNLSKDPIEKNNLANVNPDMVKKLLGKLNQKEKIIETSKTLPSTQKEYVQPYR